MSSAETHTVPPVSFSSEDVEESESHRHPYTGDYTNEVHKVGFKIAGDESLAFGASASTESLNGFELRSHKDRAHDYFGESQRQRDSHHENASQISHTSSNDFEQFNGSYRDHHSDDADSLGSSHSETSLTSGPSSGVSETTASNIDASSSAHSEPVTSDWPQAMLSEVPVHPSSTDEADSHVLTRYTTMENLNMARFTSEALELNSASMPNLTVKEGMVSEMKSDADNDQRAGMDSFALASRAMSGNGDSSRRMEEGEEMDGFSEKSVGDQEALIAPERPQSDLKFEQTMRPVQVRQMPLWFQILMVLSISMIGFGSYAAYDAVAAVQEPLMKDLNLSVSRFGWLYSVYALPNVILVIFGGKLVDYWGPQNVGFLTTVSIALGATFVAIAPSLVGLGNSGRFGIMLIGRFIFGIGAESSYVVQNSMCVKWFFGQRLATAMAITAAGTRLGSIFSFLIAPHLAAQRNYTIALWAATGTCVVSVVAVFAYMLLRSYARSHLLATNFDQNSLETAIDETRDSANRRTSRTSLEMAPMSVSDTESQVELEEEVDLEQGELDEAPVNQQKGNFILLTLKAIWRDVRSFSALFWGSAVLGLFTYGIVLGFRAVSGDTIATRYNFKPERANLALATIDITGLLAAFPVGWLVDWTYQIGWITLAGNVLSVASFLSLIPHISPFIGTVLLGLSSTVVPATIYPAISYLTPQSLEGFAFGVTSAVINLGNLILNLIIGRTLDIGWVWMCYFLIFLSLVSVGVSLWWIIKDSQQECPKLNPPRDFSPERRWLRRHFPSLCY